MKLAHTMAALAAMATATPAFAGIVDGGFETQYIGTGYCYFTSGCAAATPWGGSTSGIIHENDTSWPGIATTGLYHGFLQTVSVLTQTFEADATGTFTLNWLEGGRALGSYSGPHNYQVLIGTTLIYSGTSQPGGFVGRESGSFGLTAGESYTLSFQGLQIGSADTATFIDDVALSAGVAAVPEPASWAMMIAGFGLVGGAARRRRATVATA